MCKESAGLVPALLGYIDRAREKQYVLNAKSALTATQAEFSSLYGEDKDIVGTDGKFVRSDVVKNTADTPDDTEFYVALVEKGDDSKNGVKANHGYYTVMVAYYVEDGNYLVYDGKTWQSVTLEGSATAPTIPTVTGVTLGSSWTQIY